MFYICVHVFIKKKCNVVDKVVARVCFVKRLCDAIVGKSIFFFSKIQSCSEKERKINFLLNLLIVKGLNNVLIPFVNCLPVFTLLSD